MKYSTNKEERRAIAMGGILPNVVGVENQARKMVVSVVKYILMFGASLRSHELKTTACRTRMEEGRRIIGLRVIRG